MKMYVSFSEMAPRKYRRKLGLGLCALFVLLAACSGRREFGPGAGGTGGTGGDGGLGGTSAGGSGTGSAATGGTSGGSPNTGGTSIGSGGSDPGGTGGTGTGGTVGGGTTGGDGGAGGLAGSSGSPDAGDCSTSDPDCECVDGVVVAVDKDGDGSGSRFCEEAPGEDCDDDDEFYQHNACGGCTELPYALGAVCLQCGIYACNGEDALQCVAPEPAPRRCLNASTPEQCVNGYWVMQTQCSGVTPVCVNQGDCGECVPGTYKCDSVFNDTVVVACEANGFWQSSWLFSCYASSGQTCDATTGTCKYGMMPLPRDATFEVPPALERFFDPSADEGRPTRDVLDLASGFRFG
jgi:hypothetical protein